MLNTPWILTLFATCSFSKGGLQFGSNQSFSILYIACIFSTPEVNFCNQPYLNHIFIIIFQAGRDHKSPVRAACCDQQIIIRRSWLCSILCLIHINNFNYKIFRLQCKPVIYYLHVSSVFSLDCDLTTADSDIITRSFAWNT